MFLLLVIVAAVIIYCVSSSQNEKRREAEQREAEERAVRCKREDIVQMQKRCKGHVLFTKIREQVTSCLDKEIERARYSSIHAGVSKIHSIYVGQTEVKITKRNSWGGYDENKVVVYSNYGFENINNLDQCTALELALGEYLQQHYKAVPGVEVSTKLNVEYNKSGECAVARASVSVDMTELHPKLQKINF